MSKNISMKLDYPVYFRTTKKSEENVKQLTNPVQLEPSNNYVFPKGYDLEEMIHDAKKFAQKDNVQTGEFYGLLVANAEMQVENAAPYLEKTIKISEELLTLLNDRQRKTTIDKFPIQDLESDIRAFDIDQSDVSVYDTLSRHGSDRYGYTLRSSFFVEGCNDVDKIKFGFYKPETRMCSLEHLEEFYNATQEVYAKLLEQKV